MSRPTQTLPWPCLIDLVGLIALLAMFAWALPSSVGLSDLTSQHWHAVELAQWCTDDCPHQKVSAQLPPLQVITPTIHLLRTNQSLTQKECSP
jgi:hypothetical protein